MDEFLKQVIDFGATTGGRIVTAILVLVVGLIVIKILGKIIKKALGKSKLEDPVKNIILKIIKIILYIILLVGIIEVLGVPMTSVAALIASAGLAVGLAFQGALANLAGGFLILIFRPFKIGDYVNTAGAEGVVHEISIFYTKLMTLDNKLVLVPNGDLMSANVTNFTANETRRIDIDFKITNDIDHEFVKSVLIKAATETEGILQDPAPFTRLTAVDDDTFIFTVRAWCNTKTYWDNYFDLIENCSKALGENGIDDPEERIAIRIVGKDKEDKE